MRFPPTPDAVTPVCLQQTASPSQRREHRARPARSSIATRLTLGVVPLSALRQGALRADHYRADTLRAQSNSASLSNIAHLTFCSTVLACDPHAVCKKHSERRHPTRSASWH